MKQPLALPRQFEAISSGMMNRHGNSQFDAKGTRQEVEVKLRVANPAGLRRKLAALGARVDRRVHEKDTLYDTPAQRLRKRGQLLRLRVESRDGRGGRGLITFKGPSGRGGRYKVREEVEVAVNDPAGMRKLLRAMGLGETFRYEKIRTSYRLRRAAGVKIELDQTPIGWFVELEGPPRGIDRAARLLGYGPADYIPLSYRALYLMDCRRRGLPAEDMVFPRRKK